MKRKFVVVLALAFALGSSAAFAANIGQWTGSLRSWNHPDISVLRSLLTAQVHTIGPDGPITAANLADTQYFVIAEPIVAVTAPQAADLLAFVQGGGVLILIGDTSTNLGLLNGILTSLGSDLAFQVSGAIDAALVAGDRVVDGPPHSLAGSLLNVTTGRAVTGGSAIAGSYVRVQSIGAGKVYVLGDRLDHNTLVVNGSTVNSRFFANLFAPAPAGPLPEQIPLLSPAMLVLLSVLLAVMGMRRRR